MDAAQRSARLREHALDEGQPVDGGQAGIAQQPQPRRRHAEQPRQPVGDRLHRQDRLGAATGITFEQDRRAGIGDRTALGEHGGERLRIAEAEVNTLTGKGMHAVGRIADEREPMGDGRRQAQEAAAESSPAA